MTARSLDFRAVFDASENPYMLLDRELRFVAANRAYLEVTAARLEDLIGRHILDVFPNDPADPNNRSAQVLRQSLEKVVSTRRRDAIAYLSYRVARVAGGPPEERYWSATHTPLLGDDGEVAFILQHTEDVTDLQRLQTAARRLELEAARPQGVVETAVLGRARSVQDANAALDREIQGLRQMFDQAPGFICFLRGPEHVYEMTNRAYQRLVGERELIGKPVREALPDLAGQGIFERLDRVYDHCEPFVGRAVPVGLARTPDGEIEDVILDFIYQPIVGADGCPLGVLVQGNDVSEQKRTEVRQRFLARASEHLATSGDGLQEALQKVAAAAVDAFADWCVIDLFDEHGVARRLAFSRPDLAAAPLAVEAQQFAPSARVVREHPSLGAREPTLVRDFTEDLAQRLARSPAHLQWMRAIGLRSVIGLPLVSRGQRLGGLTFGLSESRRRFDENDLATAEEMARMASTVIDNTRLALERQELLAREQAARERAEAANQAKDEFLAMLGHELRNPLSPILTAVELLKLRGDRGSEREQTIIERQAQHLVRLVDDLLDVSRITRGKVQLEKTRTDMVAVIGSAVEMASPLFEKKQHRLRLDVARDQLFVDGDRVRLSQVVANLLTNAARYTEEGGEIHVEGRREGAEVVVRVRDSGIGIAAELLPHIFDMFVQGPRRAERVEGGLGLGLTLVRTLVTMHGGSVTASSAGVGRGSQFEVRLPGSLAPAVERPSRVADAVAVAPADHRRRVLIVDDNTDAAELLAEVLELQGYDTALAHDGPSALSRAQEFQPDVAVLDIGLPVMDGYELAERLRETLGERAPRMVALTGYGQQHDHTRSQAAGFLAHLVKPVDARELARTISETA